LVFQFIKLQAFYFLGNVSFSSMMKGTKHYEEKPYSFHSRELNVDTESGRCAIHDENEDQTTLSSVLKSLHKCNQRTLCGREEWPKETGGKFPCLLTVLCEELPVIFRYVNMCITSINITDNGADLYRDVRG
jgi:hypothetical protein